MLHNIKPVLLIIAVLLVVPASTALADVVSSDYYSRHCRPGEKEITAAFSSKEPFGPRTSDETIKYKNNPNYYELTSHTSSFGGAVKYCQIGQNSDTKLVGAGIAGLMVIAVLGLVWIRRRSAR